MVPLKVGTPEQFSELREGLQRLGYTEDAVCQRTGSKTIYEFKNLNEGRVAGPEIHDGLDALIRLLMDEVVVDDAILRQYVPAPVVGVLDELDVIRRHGESGWKATVLLYPVAGVYVVSDRTNLIGEELPADLVYAAITENTGRFLSIQPNDPGEDFLDICCGTGIAGLTAASRGAKRVYAADLGERSVHYSTFNAKLNGLDQVVGVQGDLFGAVEGLQFDCIVAHPPYVPDGKLHMLFRDGGEDGEQIFRRIVEDLPKHLKPGGRFYCVTTATDREGETLEERIRKWLGESSDQFDVLLVATEVGKRPSVVLEAVVKAKGKLGELGPRSELYERLKVTAMFYGTVVIERVARPRPVSTARCVKGETIWGAAVEWAREWEKVAVQPSMPAALARSRPHLAPEMEMEVRYKPTENGLEPQQYKLRTKFPFVCTAMAEPWLAVLVGQCTGERTTMEIFEALRAQEVVAPDVTFESFCAVMRTLISNGFVELDQFPLPRREAPVGELVS